MQILGWGFDASSGVSVGGVPATGITLISANEIDARTPSLPAGSLADLLVSNGDGSSATLSDGCSLTLAT